MKLYPEYLCADRPFAAGEELPDMSGVQLVSHGCTLNGYVLTPGGAAEELHPLAIMLHGFPGNCTNNDLGIALCRMGCVVLNVFYRGAWGSEGYYTFTGKVEDAVEVANWAVSEAVASQYRIDPENVFLVGHSMGGFAAGNAMRRLPWVKGAVLMAPYDMPWFFENGKEQEFYDLLPIGRSLRQESPDSLVQDALSCWKTMGFSQAYEDLKDRNLYFIGGSKDGCARPAEMIEPLFRRLQAHETDADQKYDLLDTDHCFADMRLRLCSMVGNWIASVAEK
ncbi:MAG: alpha/beta fold hydrolase [Oscillospiraceae bacterium]|nr:alpha/beta fold hydrolase [Oscillospiraceae bacterium]